MPYVGKEREEQLIADAKVANCVGDFNALYTMAYLRAYIANPKYETIHNIQKSVMVPQTIVEVKDIEDLLTVQQVPILDRITARMLAFAEFYDRVGRKHENLAIRKNGDLQLYKDAEQVLHKKAIELVQNETSFSTKEVKS